MRFPYTNKITGALCELLYVIMATLLVIGFPLLIASLLPIFTIRWLVAAYALHFKPNLGKMLTTRSSIFAVDDLHGKPLCNLIVVLVLEGDLTPEEFKDILLRRLLNKVNETDGKLVHPEMRQHLTSWAGFHFWKPVPNFRLDDHVIFPETQAIASNFTEEEMLSYNSKLMEKPWAGERSPWEFHVIRNYKPFGMTEDYSMTGCVFRVHHCMADGYSVLDLLTSSTDAPFQIAKPAQRLKRPSTCRICLNAAAFALRMPYDFVKTVLESWDVNEWRLPAHKLVRSLEVGYHPLVPMARLKELKAHYKVSLTSVILEIFSGTVRNYMKLTNVRVPDSLHCVTPLPLPGHPDKLRNFMTCCFTELPLGTADPIARLYKIEKHLTQLKRSTIPWTASFVQQLGGGLFTWMTKIVAVHMIGTAVMTNFPGPDRRIDIFGRQMRELNFGGGLMRGRLSFGMSSISYDGMISLIIGMDKAICPPDLDQRKVLVDLITKEIEVLESLMKQEV